MYFSFSSKSSRRYHPVQRLRLYKYVSGRGYTYKRTWRPLPEMHTFSCVLGAHSYCSVSSFSLVCCCLLEKSHSFDFIKSFILCLWILLSIMHALMCSIVCLSYLSVCVCILCVCRVYYPSFNTCSRLFLGHSCFHPHYILNSSEPTHWAKIFFFFCFFFFFSSEPTH